MAYSPFRNIGLKFLSICIAALLWLVVAGDRVVERALRVPIEFQNLPQGLEIVGDPPEDVDVRLRGSSGALGRLGPGRHVRRHRRAQRAAGTPPVSSHAPVRSTCPTGSTWCRWRRRRFRSGSRIQSIRIVQGAGRPIEGRPAPGYEVGTVTVGAGDGGSDWSGELAARVGRGDDRAGVGGQCDASDSRGGHHRRRGPSRPAAHAADRGGDGRHHCRIVRPARLSAVPVQVRNLAVKGLRGRLTPPSVAVTIRGTESARIVAHRGAHWTRKWMRGVFAAATTWLRFGCAPDRA